MWLGLGALRASQSPFFYTVRPSPGSDSPRRLTEHNDLRQHGPEVYAPFGGDKSARDRVPVGSDCFDRGSLFRDIYDNRPPARQRTAQQDKMVTLASPVELPTSRNSFVHAEIEDDDMKNPQWIPILRKLDSKYDATQEKEVSLYTAATFSPMPTYTADPPPKTPKPSSIHSYSRSSVAPETVEIESSSHPPPVPVPPLPPMSQETARQMNFELPATRPTSRYFEKTHVTGLSGDATLASTDTETTADTSRSESNAGTSTTTDDTPSVQAPATVKAEAPVPPPPAVKEDTPTIYPRSTRSSYSSTKKYSVGPPTSKFNRKPPFALPSRVTSLQSEAHVPPPVVSPKITPTNSRNPTPLPSPRLTAFPPQPASLKQSPSTVSNKAPSLRPKPSNTSLASHSSSDNANPTATLIPTQETRRSEHPTRKSSAKAKAQEAHSDINKLNVSPPPARVTEQERRKSLVEETDRLSATEKLETLKLEKPERARLAPHPIPGPSSGISSFMTANDTVIFRRFDEVHVQLLLCLQDEITQLERELLRLDSAIMTRSDRDIERGRVIRELRKVVVEYDHLFSSWSQMQASKASKATQQNLRTWLERPSTSAGAALTSKDELNWLNESKDLSAVTLRQMSGKSSGGGVSNFMGSICGKRK